MSTRPYDFPSRVEQVASLDQYLSEHRRAIGGPRTLAQAYTKYRRLVLAGTFKLFHQEDERIRKLDPGKVNWIDAYAWWKVHIESAD